MKLPVIKPCPFCGGQTCRVLENPVRVYCQQCGTYGGSKETKREAIEQWNKRHEAKE